MIYCATLLLGLHLATHHFHHPDVVLESETPGIYATCDNYTLGLVRNSVEKPLVYLVRTSPLWYGFEVSYGLGRGGYPINGPNTPIEQMWVPFLAVSKALGPVRLSLMPPYKKDVAAIHLSVEWKVEF